MTGYFLTKKWTVDIEIPNVYQLSKCSSEQVM